MTNPLRRAYLTLSPKFGAGLWLGDRLVARVMGSVEDSRVTPDEPDPLWRRDAMVFVDAVNHGSGYHGEGEFDLHYDPRCSRCTANRDRLRPAVAFDEIFASTERSTPDE